MNYLDFGRLDNIRPPMAHFQRHTSAGSSGHFLAEIRVIRSVIHVQLSMNAVIEYKGIFIHLCYSYM